MDDNKQTSDFGLRRVVPFTQYMRPDGRKKPVEFDVPDDVDQEVVDQANRFIAAGGRYECEVLSTGACSFTACHPLVPDEDVAIEVAMTNGPPVVERIVALIKKTAAWMDANSARLPSTE